MAYVFVVVMAFLISGVDSTPRAPYIDFFSSMGDGPVVDSNNDPALAEASNSSTPAPKEGVSTTPFPEDLPTYSPDAMKSIPVRRQQNSNAEQQKGSSPGAENKGQFNLMDINTWDSIPTAFFEPVAPSVNRGKKSGAPNQRSSFQNPVSFSEAGAEPSLAWDYSNVGMGSGAEMGSGGTQDVFLPLADHAPGSTQADQPIMSSDWSAPPVSKDTAKYREEPTPKPITVRFSDGESMARAILSGQVKKWEWTYSTTLGIGSSSGHGDRYDKSLTCCQRLPYICGVDGMCVIGIDECQEFCTCAANPHMPHCQKIIPIIKRTMAALEKKILAKVARELSFTTTTTARARINSNPAATNINQGMTDVEHFIIFGEQSASRASQGRKPMDSRTAAETTGQFAAVTRQKPSALPQSSSSASNSQSTSATQNIRNNSERNSQKQQFANTKPTISSIPNQGNKNVLAATSERKYPHTTATPSPKYVKTLINPSKANLKATLSHPASFSKNILTSRDSTGPTQAPTTAIRKPQNPTTAGIQPKLPSRNSKLPFTVDPDAVPTTKTTLLSSSLINGSKTDNYTNSPPSSRLTDKPTANNINNHVSIPATTYNVRNAASVTNAAGLPTYNANLKSNSTNATKTKSEMHSKEKETHASLGHPLVTKKSNITNQNLTKHNIITQNITKQMVGTGLLTNAKRIGQSNVVASSTYSVSGGIPRNTGINTGERKNIFSRHPISTSRPDNNIASTVTSKATHTKAAVPSMTRKDNAQTISTMFTGRTASVRTSTAMAYIKNASIFASNRNRFSVSKMSVGTNDTEQSALNKHLLGSESKATHTKAAVPSMTRKDNAQTISTMFTGRTASVRTSTAMAYIKNASIFASNRNRFSVSKMSVGSNDTEQSALNKHLLGSESKATHTKAAVPSMTRKDNAQTISTMFNGRTASVRTSTAMAYIKNASISASNRNRFSVSKMSVGSNDTEQSTLNKHLLGSESKATHTKAAVPSMTRKDNAQTISTMFTGRTASVRTSTAMAYIKNASIFASNRNRFSVSKMSVGSNDTEQSALNKHLLGSESKATHTKAVVPSMTRKDNAQTISTMFNGRTASVRTSTAMAYIKNASISASNRNRFSVSKMSVGSNDTEQSTLNKYLLGSESKATHTKAAVSSKARKDNAQTISTMFTGRTASVRTSTAMVYIKNTSISASNRNRFSVSKMSVGSNDTEQSALNKQLLGSEKNSTSGHGLAAVDTSNFKSSTMSTGKIPNISQEPTEIVGSNDTSGGVEKFQSLLGNSLRFAQRSSSTGRQFWASTTPGPKFPMSTSNTSTENTTPETVASTSVSDQEASAFNHQFTTNSAVTDDSEVMFYLQSLNAGAGQPTPKSKIPEEIQLVAGATREPVQGSTTIHPNTMISDKGEEHMAHTDSFTSSHTNRNPNVTNEILANDNVSVKHNYTTIVDNDEDTMLTKSMNKLTNKETTKPLNKTLDSEEAASIDASLPSMTKLPVTERVLNEIGQFTGDVTNTNVNENILEYDPSLMATSSDDSKIKPCSEHCQENAGICLLGDDLKSHCVVVSEVCHQHLCINGYCVSSDGSASCECHPGWVGAACDQKCSVDCDDRSFCVGIGRDVPATCSCRWNYTGHDCRSTRKIIQRTPDVGQASRDLETWEVAIVAVATAVVAALLCVVSPYVLWKKQWLPMRHLFFYFLPFEDDDGKDFDAFISYQASPRDERFVLQHLFPKLEKELEFRLCLSTRDFLPGESVSSSTMRAINSSRRTILILSPSYVTEWSKSEYSKARQELLKIKNKVITIVLEDFSDLQDSDPFFRSVIDTAYSIKWPGEDRSEKSSSISKFWKLLELSMPKKRNKSNSSVSSSSIYSSDVALSSCSKTRFSSNTSSIYEEVIYSSITLGGSSSDSGTSSDKTMQMRKLNHSLNGKSNFPDVLWNHQGRMSTVSLALPHESRSISSLSDDTGIESNTRSNSISSGIGICPNHVVDIQIHRIHTALGPATRGKF